MHHLMIVCCNSWFLLLRVLWKLISSDPGGFVLRVFLLIVCCNSWFLLLRVLWKSISSDPGGFVLRVFLLFVVLPTNCSSKKDEVVQFLYMYICIYVYMHMYMYVYIYIVILRSFSLVLCSCFLWPTHSMKSSLPFQCEGPRQYFSFKPHQLLSTDS